MSRLYGMFANLTAKKVLVVGGGEIAERKVSSLLEAGAAITVTALTISQQLQNWHAADRIDYIQGAFSQKWLAGTWLVIAASDNKRLNEQIAEQAKARQIFVNVVDNAKLCDFHVPSVIDRGPLQIAISTAGAAPALSRRIRAKIQAQLDHSSGRLVALVQQYRKKITRYFPDLSARRRFYDRLLDGPVAQSLEKNNLEYAEQQLNDALAKPEAFYVGQVTLLGGGPGDPGLLTLKGQRVLQDADVILYDRLVSQQVLALARRDAKLVNVGKKPGAHRIPQERINHLLVDYVRQGKHVVRLKGGDPFIFGRGGEELQHLQKHQVPFEVVPGITAAAACAAYAGIALTHRDHAQSVRFVTAHGQKSIDRLDWYQLAQERQTIAFYMGVAQLENIQKALITHGRDPHTPVAIIENGTRPQQRVVVSQLDELPTFARLHAVQSPALLIVGEVAAMAKSLSWYGQAPIIDQSKAVKAQAQDAKEQLAV